MYVWKAWNELKVTLFFYLIFACKLNVTIRVYVWTSASYPFRTVAGIYLGSFDDKGEIFFNKKCCLHTRQRCGGIIRMYTKKVQNGKIHFNPFVQI